MSVSRYNKYPFIQPVRKIVTSSSDIIHIMKKNDNLDSLAKKYYDDVTLSWVIMCANPQLYNEWDIEPGQHIIIPMPIERVWKQFGIKNEV